MLIAAFTAAAAATLTTVDIVAIVAESAGIIGSTLLTIHALRNDRD